MKEIFIQFRQWILKHKKKLIYGALALCVFQICFLNLGLSEIGFGDQVFAEDSGVTKTENFEEKMTNRKDSLSFFKVVLYVLVYPILIVAGKLVDNSMVYGEIFGFDAILWKLWVITRNIANYGLGTLFMFYIFKYLINGQNKDDIKKLLISSLIAGVGIQASWFIMAVLIDTSTLVTYSIGSLPITVLENPEDLQKEDENKSENDYNPYILKTTIYYDADRPDTINTYMSTGSQRYIAECETFNATDNDKVETLILGPKYIYYKGDGTGVKTVSTMCNYDNNVYFLSSLYDDIQRQECSNDCVTKQQDYDASLYNTRTSLVSGKTEILKTAIEQGKILQIGDAHSTGGINGMVFTGISYKPSEHRGLDVNNKWNGENGNLKRMSDLIDGTYAGVFTNLYVSLLNMGKNFKVTKSESDGIFVNVLNECLSLLFLLIITVPLIAVVIVFVMRIFIIWIAIAISPIIVLLTAFDLFKNDKINSIDFLKYFKVSNLISIIFFPAIICFAISLCSVLVEIIKDINAEVIETTELSILSGAIKLDIASFGVAIGKIICSIICLATTRFLLWASIKMTKLGDSKIISGLKDLTRSAIGSLPVVPIPTSKGVKTVGIDSAFGLNNHPSVIESLNQGLKSEFSKENQLAIGDFFGNNNPKDAEKKQAKAYVETLSGNIPTSSRVNVPIRIGSGSATKDLTFSTMTIDQQKTVLEQINTLSDKSKDELGNLSPHITIDNKQYDYDTTKKQYIEKPTPPSPGGST